VLQPFQHQPEHFALARLNVVNAWLLALPRMPVQLCTQLRRHEAPAGHHIDRAQQHLRRATLDRKPRAPALHGGSPCWHCSVRTAPAPAVPASV
jgi:hypothetical protein